MSTTDEVNLLVLVPVHVPVRVPVTVPTRNCTRICGCTEFSGCCPRAQLPTSSRCRGLRHVGTCS
jgi:hypothetical protein